MYRTIVILQILLNLILIQVAVQQYCYKINFLSSNSTDTPNYRYRVKIHGNDTISTLIAVHKSIPIPMWHITLVDRSSKQQKTFYNGTMKSCDFWKFVKRVWVFREVTALFLKPENGNISFDCPMLVGQYVAHNLRVPPDANLLKFLYAPHSTYTLYLRMLSQLPNNQVEELSKLELNATISKLC